MDIKDKELLSRMVEEVDIFHQKFFWMTLQTMMAFTLVACNKGLRLDQLQEMMGIDQSHASRIAKRLSEAEGKDGYALIQMEKDPEDKRFRVMYLTPEGESFKAMLIQHLGDINERYNRGNAQQTGSL